MPPIRNKRRKAVAGVRKATAAVLGQSDDEEVQFSPIPSPVNQEMQEFLSKFKEEILLDVRAEMQKALSGVFDNLQVQESGTASSQVNQEVFSESTHSSNLVDITGNSPIDQVNNPSSVFVPVDMHIKSTLRAKIVKNEAIDLARLLPKEIGFKRKQGKKGTDDKEEEISFENLSERKWIQAWNIFVAIYSKAHPEKLPRLAAHFQQVLDLMEAKANWQLYDQDTRLLIEDGMVDWGVTVQSIITKAQLKIATPFQVPLEFCRDFHTNGNCFRDPCKFNHKCFRCNQDNHPARFCYRPTKRFFGQRPSPSNPNRSK